MHFVNRENAVYQLQQIHEATYDRALSGAGEGWVVPICDNIFGLGKTEFALQYIGRSTAVAKSKQYDMVRLDFCDMLSQAVTVHIVFYEAELQNEDAFEEILLERLQAALIPLFNVAPVCLYQSSYADTATFLSELITEVGPVFIALDEIGNAFQVKGLDDIDRRNVFLRFCSKVLGRWFNVPKLFPLVLGRGSFLNYVGSRPGDFKMPL